MFKTLNKRILAHYPFCLFLITAKLNHGDASRCAKTNSDSVDVQFIFEYSSLNVVGFRMLNLLPRFLERPLIFKLELEKTVQS